MIWSDKNARKYSHCTKPEVRTEEQEEQERRRSGKWHAQLHAQAMHSSGLSTTHTPLHVATIQGYSRIQIVALEVYDYLFRQLYGRSKG